MCKAKIYSQMLLLVMAVGPLLLSGPIFAQDQSDLDVVRNLLHDLRQLVIQRDVLDQEQRKLAVIDLRLKEEASELKREATELKRQQDRLDQEALEGDKEQKRYNAEVDQHNSYCVGGPFPLPEVERREAWCTPNLNRLNAWKSKLDGWYPDLAQRRSFLRHRLDALEQRQTKLSQDTLDWARPKKEINAKYEEWNGRWETMQRLLLSPNLDDLKRRANATVICANLARLEDAHQCLQTIWDGARMHKR